MSTNLYSILVFALIGILTITTTFVKAELSEPTGPALWYNSNHDPIDCQDKDPMCCELMACPLNYDKYVAGFRPLIGTWNIVHEINGTVDNSFTGTLVFYSNGSMKLVFPTVVDISTDPYRLCHELGIGYRDCYYYLSHLEAAGLINTVRFKYCITNAGHEMINKIEGQ